MEAWLETSDGASVPVHGRCGLGRATDNHFVIADHGVSRRHALIHAQGAHEYWLVDLGSRNGTYLNGRRLSRPCRLRNGDRIQIGAHAAVFRYLRDPSVTSLGDSDASRTVISVRAVACWLLVADVIGSTRLLRTQDPERVARAFGSWLAECRDRIEACGGTINKFLGDGFFAYWGEEFIHIGKLAGLLRELRTMQEREEPPFRLALHRGNVTCGGGASLGEEELLGAEVSRVFRMEKLAASLKAPRLASQVAVEGLAGHGLEFSAAGSHPLDGFSREVQVYSW